MSDQYISYLIAPPLGSFWYIKSMRNYYNQKAESKQFRKLMKEQIKRQSLSFR